MEEGPHIPAKLLPKQISKISSKRGEKHIHVAQKYANKNILEPREGRGCGRWRALWLRVRMLSDRIIPFGYGS